MSDKQRFSKATVRQLIERQVAFIDEQYHFDPNDGTHQVRNRDAETNRAYGKWDTLRWLLEELGL